MQDAVSQARPAGPALTNVLVLGDSESVGGFAELFSPLDKSHRFYRRQESLRRRTFDFAPSRTTVTGLALLELPSDPARRLSEVQREADRLVLVRFAPVGVVVDEDLNVVQFRGQTGMYLQPAPGTPSLDLLQMARPGLLVDLRAALEAAQRERVSQRRERVLVQTNGHSQEITLEVLPICVLETSQRFFVVLFSPSDHESHARQSVGESAPLAPARTLAIVATTLLTLPRTNLEALQRCRVADEQVTVRKGR